MSDLVDMIVQFAQGHSTLVLTLFGLSELLAYIPNIKGNSVFQTLGEILSALKNVITAPPTNPPAK